MTDDLVTRNRRMEGYQMRAQPGDFVKIHRSTGRRGESFWCLVLVASRRRLRVRVRNELMLADELDLDVDDVLEVNQADVIDHKTAVEMAELVRSRS